MEKCEKKVIRNVEYMKEVQINLLDFDWKWKNIAFLQNRLEQVSIIAFLMLVIF